MDGHSFLKAFSARLPYVGNQVSQIQEIHFNGNDDEGSSEIYGKETCIYPSPSGHTSGSSKLRVQSVVDHAWDEHYYIGKLVAAHLLGNYVAYAIKATGKSYGMVRVVSRLSEQSTLLKGMKGLVRDLSFAHIKNEVILAVVDEYGCLFVYEISEGMDESLLSSRPMLNHKLLIETKTDVNTVASEFHRVIWCPYIPEGPSEDDKDDDDNDSVADDGFKLLAVTHDSTVEIWNVDMVVKEVGEGIIDATKVTNGYLKIDEERSKPLIDGAFSPDGTALATASSDGCVKFFQVHVNGGEDAKPKCLHIWNPHPGKSLSCLFFLDDHMVELTADGQLWKYAITGAEYNSELKLWCCATWNELQCIRFDGSPRIKAELDLSANYLLLSDIQRKAMYVVTIGDRSNGTMALNSISEFLLSQPMLSMAVLNTKVQHDEDIVEFDEDCVRLHLYYIQPKSLQRCTISFKPPSVSTASSNKLGPVLANGLPPIQSLHNGTASIALEDNLLSFAEVEPNKTSSTNILTSNAATQPPPSSSILMTPEAFSSPGRTSADNSLSQLLSLVNGDDKSAIPESENILTKLMDMSVNTGESKELEEPELKHEKQSAASSPSREVQEILGEEQTDMKQDEADTVIEEEKPDTAGLPSEMKMLNVSGSSGFPSPPAPPTATAPPLISPSEFHADGVSAKASSSLNIKLKACQVNDDETTDPWPPCPPKGDSTDRANSLESVVAMLKEQRQQIQKLQSELKDVQRDSLSQEEVREIAVMIKSIIAAEREETDTLMIEEALRRFSSDPSMLQQPLIAGMTPLLQDAVHNEIQTAIQPVIREIKQMVHSEMSLLCSQFSSVDKTLTDNINSVVNSKVVVDNLGNACAQVLGPTLTSSYKQAFGTTFITVFEDVARKLLGQLNEMFSRGTSEYLSQIEGHVDKQRRSRDQLMGQMSNCRQQMDKLPEDVAGRIDATLSEFTERLVKAVSSEVGKNQQQLEGRIMSAVRSGAATPLPSQQSLDAGQVLSLLARGEYNQAFQQALTASDLRLVETCIQQAKHTDIFATKPCPLTQPVILSLLQQLASNLHSNTDVKLKYIEGCLTSLDIRDQAMKEHAPGILKSLIYKIDEYIKAKPNSSHATSMRFIKMVANALISQH